MRVLLVDGTNVIIRYAHAMLPDVMQSRDRVQVRTEDADRVCKAVESALFEAAEFTKSTHAIVALDSISEPSWRKAVYPDYKCSRTTITGAWSARLARYLAGRWLTLAAPSYEADDVIATLAERLGVAGKPAVVLSGDSDLLALIDPDRDCRMIQFSNKRDEPRFLHREYSYVVDKYGVPPKALRLWKALVGEPGDDLPGVRKVGPKKAATLLAFANNDLVTLRGLMPTATPTGLAEFDQMLAVVTLNTKVPLEPIDPKLCKLPPKPQ